MSAGRDYRKMTVPRDRGGFSGTTGLVVGLMLGGLGAFFAYQKGKEVGAAGSAEMQPVKKPASVQAAEDDASGTPPTDTIDYTFYDRLKQQGVDVPSKKDAPPPADVPLDDEPGLYLVQVVSLPKLADADAVRAQLALKGFQTTVSTVEVNGTTWHRVVIGPLPQLATANELAERLKALKYSPQVNRVAD